MSVPGRVARIVRRILWPNQNVVAGLTRVGQNRGFRGRVHGLQWHAGCATLRVLSSLAGAPNAV